MKAASRRRVVVWGGAGLVIAAALGFAIAPRPVPVDVAKVIRGRLVVTLDHEGKTRVRERYSVAAPLPGRVLRIELEPGDRVRGGETVVATIMPASPTLLDARSRAEATARVKAAEAAVERARADYAAAGVQHRHALAEQARQQGLEAEGVVTARDREAAETLAAVRARTLEAADAGVRAATHDLSAARATLVELAEGRSIAARSTGGRVVAVRAPVDGVVLARLHESEAIVPQGTPLVEIADLGSLELIADFLSADVVRMRPGMRVVIEQWGGRDALAGRVRRVEPAAFLKVSALGVEEQRVWVVIDFDNPRDAWQELGDGYRVEARVVVWERDGVLKVPTSSLFRHGDGWAVFTVSDGRARLRPVDIGQRNGIAAEVTGGIELGAEVIVHPSDEVMDGVRVTERQM